MRTQAFVVAATLAIVAAGSAVVSADRVRLRSGKIVDGSFMSADAKAVRVLLANGAIAEFPVGDLAAVEFAERKAPPAPAKAPDPARAPAPITIPQGTVLNVRLTQDIEVDAAQAGH